MGEGTPVIASNLAVCRELIDHEKDGWLVTPDSPRSLANAMLFLLNDPKLISQLGENGKEKIYKYYNKENFESRLYAVYKHAATNH